MHASRKPDSFHRKLRTSAHPHVHTSPIDGNAGGIVRRGSVFLDLGHEPAYVLAELFGEHLHGVQGVLLHHRVGLGVEVLFHIHPLYGSESAHEVDVADPVHAEEAEVPPLCGAVFLMLLHEDGLGIVLQGVVQGIDVSEERGPCIGQATPSWHLHGDGAPWICQDVPGVYGQGREGEQRTSRFVDGEVDDGTERIPSPSMVHLGHDGAQRGVPGLFEQVPHGFGFGGQVSGCRDVGDAGGQRCPQ